MSFMKGKAPIRRTLEYLKKGNLLLKKEIRVMTINYNNNHPPSKGLYNFVFWNLPQVKFKNRHVQIVTFRNMTPSPCIKFFFGDGLQMTVDVDSCSRHEIMAHLKEAFSITEEQIREEEEARLALINPANFGYNNPRWCICEVVGQVPCPGWVPLDGKLKTPRTNPKKAAET